MLFPQIKNCKGLVLYCIYLYSYILQKKERNPRSRSSFLPQVLMPLLKGDLYEVLLHTLDGTLASHAPVWHQESSAVTVVMASAGYPGTYEKGVQITGTYL